MVKVSTRKPRHVVFVSRQRLVGPTNGSSAYLLDLAAAVKRAGMSCTLVQPSPSLFGRMPVLRLRSEMNVFSEHRVRGSIRLGRLLLALSPSIWLSAVHGVLAKRARRAGYRFRWLEDRKAPYSIAVPWTVADKAYISKHTPAGSIMIADYIFQTEAFTSPGVSVCATATIMHDLFHRRAAMVAETGGSDSVATIRREEEVELLKRSDLVIAIQPAEADFVREHLPGKKVLTIPMSFHPVDVAQPGRSAEILFVGSNTEPNIAGLKWFLDSCWPEILHVEPGANLGSGLTTRT